MHLIEAPAIGPGGARGSYLQRLHAQIEALSHQHPRLGYRKLVRLLRRGGWQVGRKLVQRIRREHGLPSPAVDQATPTAWSVHGYDHNASRARQPSLKLGLQ